MRKVQSIKTPTLETVVEAVKERGPCTGKFLLLYLEQNGYGPSREVQRFIQMALDRGKIETTKGLALKYVMDP